MRGTCPGGIAMKITSMLRRLTNASTSEKRPSSGVCSRAAEPVGAAIVEETRQHDAELVMQSQPPRQLLARRVQPTMIARRACVASMSSARVIDCSSSWSITSSTGVTSTQVTTTRREYCSEILGDVAERQQAGHQHRPAPQQDGGELEPAGDHLRGLVTRRQHRERECRGEDRQHQERAVELDVVDAREWIEHQAGQQCRQRIHEPQHHRRHQRRAALEDDGLTDLVIGILSSSSGAAVDGPRARIEKGRRLRRQPLSQAPIAGRLHGVARAPTASSTHYRGRGRRRCLAARSHPAAPGPSACSQFSRLV